MSSCKRKRILHLTTWTLITCALMAILPSIFPPQEISIFLIITLIPMGTSLLLLLGYPDAPFVFSQAVREPTLLALIPAPTRPFSDDFNG